MPMTVSMRSATYRLYPRREQERKMIRFLNGTRRVYNHLVHVCKNCILLGVSIPTEFELMGMATRMRQEEPEMRKGSPFHGMVKVWPDSAGWISGKTVRIHWFCQYSHWMTGCMRLNCSTVIRSRAED